MLFYQEKDKIDDKNIKLLYEHLALCWKMISFYLGDNELTFNLLHDIKNKNGFINKNYDIKKLIKKCKSYLKNQGEKSWWYEIRHAQFILEFSNNKAEKKEAMDVINHYSTQDNKYAKNVLSTYSFKGKFKEKFRRYGF